jgi:uncharacterized protein
MTVQLTDLKYLDLSPFHNLNNEHQIELSKLTLAELGRLVRVSCYAFGALDPVSFCLAFDHAAHYESPNYLWFKARRPRFVYVDRIVVEAAGRGQGLARQYYAALIEQALGDGHTFLCAEVNSAPANPASDTFHARLGFVEVGAAHLAGRGKSVRYLELPLVTPVSV